MFLYCALLLENCRARSKTRSALGAWKAALRAGVNCKRLLEPRISVRGGDEFAASGNEPLSISNHVENVHNLLLSFRGGILEIVSTLVGSGLIPVMVMMWPRKRISLLRNSHCDGLATSWFFLKVIMADGGSYCAFCGS